MKQWALFQAKAELGKTHGLLAPSPSTWELRWLVRRGKSSSYKAKGEAAAAIISPLSGWTPTGLFPVPVHRKQERVGRTGGQGTAVSGWTRARFFYEAFFYFCFTQCQQSPLKPTWETSARLPPDAWWDPEILVPKLSSSSHRRRTLLDVLSETSGTQRLTLEFHEHSSEEFGSSNSPSLPQP